jgi:hypothetical protein
MKVDAATQQPLLRPNNLFRAFKYTIYALLALNIFLFFQEDYRAAQQVFLNGVNLGNFVEAYSATIDTAAWLVLLVLFELETAVIPDHRLRGGLKWVLMAVRAVCYAFIVWSFWGYWVKLGMVSNLQAFTIADVCSLVGSEFTHIVDLDEYIPIDAAACAALNVQELVRVSGTNIIASSDAATAAVRLAMVDVINAADWLLIVLLLEVEVLMQLRGALGERTLRAFKFLKVVLYSILFLAAVYWWFKGDFLDFWDAFLWLLAFMIIELNIFNWHAEVLEEQAAHGAEATPDAGGRGAVTTGMR